VRTNNGAPPRFVSASRRYCRRSHGTPWLTPTALARFPRRRHRRPIGGEPPVDDVAPVIRKRALPRPAGGARISGHRGAPPRAAGVGVRQALQRRYGITGLADDAVLPVIGTKELIAWLPTPARSGPRRRRRGGPKLAYPTYEVGAQLAGAQMVRADLADSAGTAVARIGVSQFAKQIRPARCSASNTSARWWAGARERGALIASDECYLGLGWDAHPVSVLASVGLRRRPTPGCWPFISLSKTSVAGRLPRGVRRRRPRGRRRAAGGAQACRDDGGRRPVQGRDGGPRLDDDAHEGDAARAVCRDGGRPLLACAAIGRAGGRRNSEAGGCTSGRPAASRAATHRRVAGAAREFWWRPASFYGPRGSQARPGGVDRDRRADRRLPWPGCAG